MCSDLIPLSYFRLIWGKILNVFFLCTNQCLSLQIKLADKQAALEKMQWEMMTSNQKVEKLQDELDSLQADISAFTLLLEGLSKADTAEYIDDYEAEPYGFNHLPDIVSL